MDIATKEDAETFVRQSFSDAVTWKAAAILLDRLRNDPSYGTLDPALRAAIERFMESHPAPR